MGFVINPGEEASASAPVRPSFTYGLNGLATNTAVLSGTTNVKTATTQAIGTLTADIDELVLHIYTTATRLFVIDLYAGASVIYADRVAYLRSGTTNVLRFPLSLANGAAIGLRTATNSNAASLVVGPIPGVKANDSADGYAAAGTLTTPSSTGTANGVAINVFSALNTWTQLTGGTLNAAGTLTSAVAALDFFFHNGTDVSRLANSYYHVDIGIGEAAAQIVLIPNLVIGSDTAISVSPHVGPFKVDIPSGSKLWWRVSAVSGTVADPETLNIVAHGYTV